MIGEIYRIRKERQSMKNFWKAGAVLMAAALFMTGCGNSKKAQEATTEGDGVRIEIDYSAGLTDEGKLEGIKASDYVTLCDYSNIEVPKKEIEPSDDEVQTQVDNLLSNPDYGVYDRAVKKGDTVNIDYVGKIDGKEFSGGSATGQDLVIGSKSFIDNFEDQIIGHTPGETFDVKVTFPKDYASADVAGKDAVFSVTLNYIAPELTDDFVKKYFNETDAISTVKEMKNSIKDTLRETNENNYIWNYLLTNSKFKELPEELMDKRLESSLNVLRKQYHDYLGYGDEQILSMYGYKSMDEVKENLRENTETSVKYFLIASAISDEHPEELNVEKADLDKILGTASADSYYDIYGKPYTNANILVTMVGDYIMDHATVK